MLLGKPGLFIEEIQSDRHQEGRKKGYEGERKNGYQENGLPDGWKVEEGGEGTALFKVRNQDGRLMGYADTRESAIAAALGNFGKQPSGVPDAPYRSTWPLQMFKRALRDAVASGKSWVGWTPGQVHTDRWGTERIEWAKQKDGSWLVNAKSQHGGVAGGVDLEGEANARGLNKENSATVRTLEEFKAAIAPSLTEGQNVETLGPKLWKRAQAEDSGVSMPRKEGFEHSYDSNEYKLGMVDVFGKYVKQWGAKVERSGVINSDAATTITFEQIPFNSTLTASPIWKVADNPPNEGIRLFRRPSPVRRSAKARPGLSCCGRGRQH
jgi:hypothetical protein